MLPAAGFLTSGARVSLVFRLSQISLSVYVAVLWLARRLVAWRGKPFDKELKGYVLGEVSLSHKNLRCDCVGAVGGSA